jgi:hypothetical protein
MKLFENVVDGKNRNPPRERGTEKEPIPNFALADASG